MKRCLFTYGVLLRMLKALGEGASQAVGYLERGQWQEYLSMKLDPNGFDDWRDFFSYYQSINLLKKFDELPTGINTKRVALEQFHMSENSCREANFRLLRAETSEFGQILVGARRHIRRILGTFSWDDTLPYLSHGPGATNGSKRDFGHPWYKFGNNEPTATGELAALDEAFMNLMPSWRISRAENGVDRIILAGSYVTTVPKDARSDRLIAVEPLLNMFYQKGIGGLMRSRLRKKGVDLNDQTVNQRFALAGSLDGDLATLDLSRASDSVSRQLVRFLFPDDWYEAMAITRCKFTVLPSGDVHFLQKFSSMGNGFTFELESVIFYALCLAVADSLEMRGCTISVYGDDIIVPCKLVEPVLGVLEFCGFSVNLEKSFWAGPFRESCGKHYFRGYDVTPFYAKHRMDDPQGKIYFANSVKRLASRFSGHYGLDNRFQDIHEYIVGSLGSRYVRLSIPEGYGDGGLLRDFDECVPRPRANRHWVEGYSTRHLTREYGSLQVGGLPSLCRFLLSSMRSEARPVDVKGGLVYGLPALRGLDSRSPGFGELPTKRYRLVERRLVVPQWRNLGPWVKVCDRT